MGITDEIVFAASVRAPATEIEQQSGMERLRAFLFKWDFRKGKV
jgi:hypothetical protein